MRHESVHGPPQITILRGHVLFKFIKLPHLPVCLLNFIDTVGKDIENTIFGNRTL